MNSLLALKKECLSCRKCGLGGPCLEGMLANVFSNMCVHPRLMVVGQNPGREEVERGQPFVGTSGKFFDSMMLEHVGLTRKDMYICNTVCCYTPGNRKPSQNEIDTCRDFLDRQIELVKPMIIVALGSPAFKQLTGMSGITKHRGIPEFSIRYKCHVFPLLHPSPYNTSTADGKAAYAEDLKILKAFLLKREAEDGR